MDEDDMEVSIPAVDTADDLVEKNQEADAHEPRYALRPDSNVH